MTLAAGTKLDSYEVLGLLGAGGMGEVYRARDSVLKREVAIKLLPPFVSQDPDRLHRFEQEAQAAAALNHPNILAVHQFGVFEGVPYLVSELLEGGTLRQLLGRGPMPVRKAIDYGVQIAHGLSSAHEKGIVHRDLKPENLFVTKDGRIKILDFGLAKLMQHQPEPDGTAPTMTHQTDPGMVMGTVGYMSPEQVRGKTVDHRSDIFAFGAILYEMLTGKRAFQRSTSAETMTAILNDDPPGISQLAPTTPPGLQRVLHRCLEKSPEQRFHSASDLAFALEALSDSGNSAVVANTKDSGSRWVWVGAAGAVIVFAALLIVWWRTPPAVPVVESVTALTDDGEPKVNICSDDSRIYFNEVRPGNWRIAQVSVSGGATARVETRFANPFIVGLKPDGSALLAAVLNNSRVQGAAPLWLIPLPAGEPRRLGNFEADNADMFPDGRIVFAKLTQGTDAKGADSRTDWFVAEKDGSDPRKLVSLPGRIGLVWVAPDGQRILIEEDHDGARRILDIAADGTGVREIRKESPDECCFSWTPDKKYLLYQSGNAQQSDIWALPLKTGMFRHPGSPIRLTNGPLPYSDARASRDGKQIFVLGTKQRGELVRYDMKSHQFQPFLSGISATQPTFSRDGKWVAYTSYPDQALWRSRSDGSERMQLTYPPVEAGSPFISPDGTRVAFHTDKGEIFVISMEGRMPQRIAEEGFLATWSPDGNYLLYGDYPQNAGWQIVDVRTGKSSIPSSQGKGGFWETQDTLVTSNQKLTGFLTFNLKTRTWTDLGPKDVGKIVNWMISPDSKYLYFTTGSPEPKVERIRFADQQIETITGLKDLHSVLIGGWSQLNVAPDGSPIFTRDTGYQEVYALNVRWP
jgi:serine/threonine protein kinase/Tol biopolymer transport system component